MLILVCRSRVFDSFVLTIFLSSRAVALMVTMFRLMRSGDWTIRERVDNTASESTDISFKITSWNSLVRRERSEFNEWNNLALTLFGFFLFDLFALFGKFVVKLFEH